MSLHTSLSSDASVYQRLVSSLHGKELQIIDKWAVFSMPGEVEVVANIRSNGHTLRVRFYLPAFESDFFNDAMDWVDAQPQPGDGVLELDEADGFWTPRVVAERDADHDWSTDPLRDELRALLTSWKGWMPPASRTTEAYAVRIDDDPFQIDPRNAWLFFCGEDGVPTPAECRDARRRNTEGVYDYYWTAAKQVEPGDLVLIYVMNPVKAVTHVARAVDRSRLDDAYQAENRPQRRARKEHWVHLSAPVEIEPIPLARLQEAAHHSLLLRGNAQYLRPEWIARLAFEARDPQVDALLATVARTPVGDPDLGDPTAMDFAQWRDLASGPLFNEKLVERHVVEPLLRIARGVEDVRPQHRIDRRRADYVLFRDEAPAHVIEVKLAIDEPASGTWTDSPDFVQTRWYADRLGVASILIDANRIMLIDRGADAPHATIERRSATLADLELIRHHLGAGPMTAVSLVD